MRTKLNAALEGECLTFTHECFYILGRLQKDKQSDLHIRRCVVRNQKTQKLGIIKKKKFELVNEAQPLSNSGIARI